MIDKTKIDLTKPAFGSEAQTLSSLTEEPKETSVEEPKQNSEIEATEEETESSVENKVPYSRFKNIHNRALEAEAEAEKWRLRAEEIEQSRTTRYDADEPEQMPSDWKELYGDSEASQKAWAVQQRREAAIERRAYEAGQRGAEELEVRQAERINTNIASIDENFEDLSAYVGRNLTAKEQSAVLDIVDDFTPKDETGRYAGPLISFDKAWELYELKQGSANAAKRQSRDNVASLTGTSSQGSTEVKADDEAWNPLERGTWKKRLGL